MIGSIASPAAAAELVHSSEDAIIGLTLDGIVTSWNPAAERLYGYSADEMVGYRLRHVVPDDLWDVETRRIARVVEGTTQRVANTARIRRDGTRLIVSSSMFPVRDDMFRITAVGMIERDITEQRALEAELLQAKRMEIVGRLARGAAQEFNNINTAILGLTEFLATHVAGNAAALGDVEGISEQARRGARMAGHLLAFNRRDVSPVGPVSINAVLRSMEPLLQRLVSERVWLTLDLDPTEVLCAADENRLELVLFELLMRSSDALHDHGSITIATRRARVDDTVYPTPAGVPSGHYVEVSLRSVSSTIAPPTSARRSRGDDWDFSELGLAMVVSTLRQLGGHLVTDVVNPDPSVISELAIYLPLREGDVASASAAELTDATGDEAILLVEDDAAVRGVLARALRDRGYRILEAQNGDDALNVVSAHAAPIDLVVSDVVMPQMDGRSLFDQMRSWYPGIRFLFVSGYTRGALATADLRGPHTDFLAKPFRMDTLAEVVRRLLDQGTVSAAPADRP